MSIPLWSFDQLARFSRYEDSEVRCWATERLVDLYPEEAPDVIADLILDDHDATPELVAEHLAEHGASRHLPSLLRGFRRGTGMVPGRSLRALARLGYEGIPELAETALHRRDLSEPCLGLIVAALAGTGSPGSHPAPERARELLLRRPELFADPAALRAAVDLYAPADLSELILKWLTALHFRGAEQIESSVRVLLEVLQLEDCGWCVRTDLEGRIDLDRTLKAIESGYDLDLRDSMGVEARESISRSLQGGEFAAIAGCLGGYIRERLGAERPARESSLATRLDAFARAFQAPEVLEVAEGLGPAVHQWLIGVLIASVIKAATYRDYLSDLREAEGDLDRLLELAGLETSCVLSVLPEKVYRAVRAGSGADKARAVDWCVRTLEARGPFFPKAIALDTLGLLESIDLIPEIAAHLADDNAYVYGAAERALSRLGSAVIEHTRTALVRGGTPPEALQSLVRLACETASEEALRLVLDHVDDLFEAIGPEAAAEAVAQLGHRELVPHLRRWLPRAPAMVGHALLLVSAIHNLPIPEEESILRAIDEYWKGATDGGEDAEGPGGPSGQYLM